MKISREVKAAILVVSGILLFIYLFNYLKGESVFSNENTYYTEFEYNALTMSSLVTIKGNSVGKVNDITYDFESGKTKVSFSVNPKLKFSKNSVIRLYETGLMGGNALAIIQAEDNDYAKNGEFIASEVQPGLISSLTKNFSGLSTDLDRTLQSADTLLVGLNHLVTDESDQGLKSTIAELNTTLKSFKKLSYSLQNVVKKNDDKISTLLENFGKVSENLIVVSDDFKNVKLSKTINNLDKTLASMNSMLASIDKGQGSIGKLLKDEKLYNNLEGATREMEELLRDIKLHPARYRRILSKKEIPYKKEEN
ncbi:MlaD family protein [Ichthyenterobacterium magnum]|uniref:Phospholipid/cholesterol/gamma-HCH transport system substrate-binding protein n=1 Tax=Ichthyenterobacterium magnum TaxID=1230530 RepID=A0A420DMG2_9FLAO|nr:MlaD family protein [Ichthyenterobacterium magnum]RKE95432.1 phospholipid/cholesterol/gamma-HCH transport system substrate-binding protein [Ichthyenterobacterium magnum]